MKRIPITNLGIIFRYLAYPTVLFPKSICFCLLTSVSSSNSYSKDRPDGPVLESDQIRFTKTPCCLQLDKSFVRNTNLKGAFSSFDPGPFAAYQCRNLKRIAQTCVCSFYPELLGIFFDMMRTEICPSRAKCPNKAKQTTRGHSNTTVPHSRPCFSNIHIFSDTVYLSRSQRTNFRRFSSSVTADAQLVEEDGSFLAASLWTSCLEVEFPA